MLTLTMFGALLLLCGIVHMAGAAIYRGRMTDAHVKAAQEPQDAFEKGDQCNLVHFAHSHR